MSKVIRKQFGYVGHIEHNLVILVR